MVPADGSFKADFLEDLPGRIDDGLHFFLRLVHGFIDLLFAIGKESLVEHGDPWSIKRVDEVVKDRGVRRAAIVHCLGRD